MKRGACLALLAFCCLGVAPQAAGQPAQEPTAPSAPQGGPSDSSRSGDASIEGTVADADGLIIPGAVVVLRNTTTGIQRAERTDTRGRFLFRGVTPGQYEVVATVSGFTPAIVPAEPTADAPIEIRLTPAVYEESVTIVSDVRADRLRDSATAPVTVIEGSDMRSAAYETVADALGEIAGVVSRRGSEGTAAAGQQIQGIDSRQVLVLVDGQPVVGARGIKSGIINLDRESVRGLDRVEVVKGAASALYGSDAMGGVINLIPREPRRPVEIGASTSGGNFGAGDASADIGSVRSWGTVFLSAGHHERDSFDLTPTTPDTSGASIERRNVSGRMTGAVGGSWALAGNVTSYWNTQRGRSLGESGLQEDETRANAQSYGFRATRQLGNRTSLELRAYHGRYDEASEGTLLDTARTPIEPGDLAESLVKTDATLSRFLSNHHQLRAGVEWIHDEYRGTNRIRDTDGDAVQTGVAWAQYDVNAFNRLTVSTGLRYDAHSEFGGAWSPKLGAVARLSDSLTARASFGRGFRAPDVGQLYYRFRNPTSIYQVIGNPLLEPERSRSWQGGIEARLPFRWRVGLNLFRNDVDNLIESVNLGFIASPAQLAAIMEREGIDPSFSVQLNRLLFLYKNVSKVETRGAEIDSDMRIGSQVRLAGSYAYLDAINEETGEALGGRNRHHGTIRADWTHPRLGLRANLRGSFYSSWIVSSSRSTSGATTAVEAPGFNLWDVTIAKTLVGGAEVFTAIDNLTDNQDPNTGLLSPTGAALPVYRPEIGRTYRVGLRWGWSK